MSDVYALEVQTLFRGVPIACKQVVRDRARRRRALFVVGSTARADAPVAPAFVAPAFGAPAFGAPAFGAAATDRVGVAHPLVLADGEDGHYSVCLTPRMAGAIARGDDGLAVSGLVRMPPTAGGSFTLRPGDRARVDCGAMTFLLASAPRAAAIDGPPFGWRTDEMRHHLLAALAVTIALVALLYVPEDPRALALDLLTREPAWARVLIKPPVAPPADDPPMPAPVAAAPGGRPSAAARGPAGAAGDPSTRSTLPRRAAARGNTRPSDIARTSPNPAAISQMGVLAYLSKSEAARAIFARDSVLGANAEDVLGSLVAAPIGGNFGNGGLGRLGTGAGNAGQGEGTIGDRGGPLATIGVGGGGPPGGYGYGPGIGALGPRKHTHPPEILPGIITSGNGSLDREIIRRIIRRHLNEVKFCYEQELLRRPALGGRILVRFMIGANGQVLTSVLETSTMGDARVESCTVQAVRRWEFPRPLNGGLVTVTYPFVMTPAASGN